METSKMITPVAASAYRCLRLSIDTGNQGGEEHALNFFDIKDYVVAFSDREQPNAQWY